MRSKISEKSLEMNVNENLVNLMRQQGGLFAKTFIYGFTLREEMYHGFDSSINLPGATNFLFSLQYKKPISKHGVRYRFEINTNRKQHIILLISSILYGNVWYVFPLFIDTSELSSSSPNFLDRTCFVNIRDFPLHSFDSNIHIVEINSQNYSGYIFSDEKASIRVWRGEEFLRKIIEEVKPITVEEIKTKELLWESIYKNLENLGIKRSIIDTIREKEGKLRHRFTSGFFSEKGKKTFSYPIFKTSLI